MLGKLGKRSRPKISVSLDFPSEKNIKFSDAKKIDSVAPKLSFSYHLQNTMRSHHVFGSKLCQSKLCKNKNWRYFSGQTPLVFAISLATSGPLEWAWYCCKPDINYALLLPTLPTCHPMHSRHISNELPKKWRENWWFCAPKKGGRGPSWKLS